MSYDSYQITGRVGMKVNNRLSVYDLQNNQKQFALFVLAYLVVQDRASEVQNLLSNFTYTSPLAATFQEIAGIHGLPYSQYSGDPNDADQASHYNGNDKKDTLPSPSRFGGYCNHGSVLFPTWHRVYMLLVEQAVGNVAVALATYIEDNYSQAGNWLDDANKLRFPFWDWAAEDVDHLVTAGIPDALSNDNIDILDPTSSDGTTLTSIANPLAFYPFPNILAGFKPVTYQDDNDKTQTAYFDQWHKTLRHANSSPSANESNTKKLNQALKVHQTDLRTKIARLFTFKDEDCNGAEVWDEFSNHTIESLRDMKYHSGSLEGVHDSIHDIIGGNGHMSFPDYAGFDPIFFVHHASVDRLFALWEWCYPSYWMDYNYEYTNKKTYPWTQGRGTYFEVYNEQVDPDSDLGPFRNGRDKYWNSFQTRFLGPSAVSKYYAYPEFAGIDVTKPATSWEQRDTAREAVQNYYGLNPDDTENNLAAALLKIFRPPAIKGHKSFNYRVFIVAVQLPEHAFNMPYTFRLHYQKSKHEVELIGSVAVFARPDYSPCKGCASRRDNRNMVRGVITIPPTLVDHIICTSEGGRLNNEDVLESELVDGIKKLLIGRLLDSAGLELGVGHAKEPSTGGETLPSHLTPGEIELRSSATAGLELGVGHAKEPSTGGETLPSHLAPGEIELRSSAIARPSGGGPAHFYDWKYHDEVFQHGWRKGGSFPSGL